MHVNATVGWLNFRNEEKDFLSSHIFLSEFYLCHFRDYLSSLLPSLKVYTIINSSSFKLVLG